MSSYESLYIYTIDYRTKEEKLQDQRRETTEPKKRKIKKGLQSEE